MDTTTASEQTQLQDHVDPANPAPSVGSAQGSSADRLQAPEPTHVNANEPANCRRFLADFGDRLTIAYDEVDPCVDIYALEDNGRLSSIRARMLLMETAQRYLQAACKASGGRLVEKEHFVVFRDASQVSQASYFDKVSRVIRMVLMQLEETEVRHGVRMVQRAEMDANRRYLGAPNGIIDLYTGQLAPVETARNLLVSASIPDDYDPDACHPDADRLFPPPGEGDPDALHRQRVYAAILQNWPRRQLIAELCPSGSGKTTEKNAVQRALGDQYVVEMDPVAWAPSGRRYGGDPHNGDRLKLRLPARIAYTSEISGRVDGDFLKKAAGGEAYISARNVAEKRVTFRPSAFPWFQTNIDRDQDGVESAVLNLGIHGSSDDAAAIRSRAKIITRPALDGDSIDPTLVDRGGDLDDADDRRFRQAVAARLVAYCAAHPGQPFPEDTPTMEERLYEQVQREMPPWQRQWLPNVLTARSEGHGEASDAWATSVGIYEDLQSWWEDNADGRLPSKAVVGKSVATFYMVKPVKKQQRIGKKLKTFSVYPGLVLTAGAPSKSPGPSPNEDPEAPKRKGPTAWTRKDLESDFS